MDKLNSSQNVLIFADKTRNIYEAAPETYNKLLTDNITKTYKLGSDVVCEDINSELKKITNDLSISDRVDTMAKYLLLLHSRTTKKISTLTPNVAFNQSIKK